VTHVLLLGYHFPPLGGAGVQRNARVARHLTSLGYRVSVVTGPGRPEHRWSPVDATMAAELPAEVSVHRVSAPEPSWTGSRVQRWLRLTRVWQRWWEEHAIPLALEAGRDADVVYASISPYSTAGAAATVGRRLGVPVIFDFEDPWALDEMLVHETALHARLERRTMGRKLARADAIVMNTPEAAARVRATFPRLAGTPVLAIANGFDAADFAAPERERPPGAFRIVHTGSLHTELGGQRRLLRRLVGGATAGVEFKARSLVYLTRALDELDEADPGFADRVELHLAGRLTDGDRAVIAHLPFVHEHGFLPHDETIALIRSADLLFLPMHDVQPGRRVSIVPCKTYEYLASRRPILAAVPDGDARDLLAAAGTARLCRPTDVAALKDALVAALDDARQGVPAPTPEDPVLEQFEWRSLTRQIAGVIDSVASRRATAGTAPVHAVA
jgi:glycosyltransferase involved in cell wall biosynthesis